MAMYGTIARMRLKPGSEPQMKALLASAFRAQGGCKGWVFYQSNTYQSNTDPNEYWLSAAFESWDAFANNKGSDEYRNLPYFELIDDIQWHDGPVVASSM